PYRRTTGARLARGWVRFRPGVCVGHQGWPGRLLEPGLNFGVWSVEPIPTTFRSAVHSCMNGEGVGMDGSMERGLTRGSALKLGAAGILGAALGGLLPGRASAGGITAAPCRAGQGYRCGTVGTGCGAPGSGCGCATQYTGSKLQNTNSYCVHMNVCCDTLSTCPNGQSQCPPGYICSST